MEPFTDKSTTFYSFSGQQEFSVVPGLIRCAVQMFEQMFNSLSGADLTMNIPSFSDRRD